MQAVWTSAGRCLSHRHSLLREMVLIFPVHLAMVACSGQLPSFGWLTAKGGVEPCTDQKRGHDAPLAWSINDRFFCTGTVNVLYTSTTSCVRLHGEQAKESKYHINRSRRFSTIAAVMHMRPYPNTTPIRLHATTGSRYESSNMHAHGLCIFYTIFNWSGQS